MKWVNVFSIIAVVCCTQFSTEACANEKKNVAVLDLETRGATTKEEAKALTDRLRSILVRTDAFNVVDRGKMEAILQEVGFQQSGCTSTECAVEVGRILNVKQMVSGSIGKIGSMYTIDIAAIDVQSSAILKSFSRDYKGEIEGLIGIMSEIANQLAGGQATQKQNGEIGSLLLTSNPEAAQVFLDNKAIGKTPLKVDEVEEGDHKIKVIADGYKDSEGTIAVKKGKVNKFNITMKKNGSKKWLWLGTSTVVVAGGTAAYVLLNQKKSSEEQTGSFPAPPGRP